MYDLMYWYIFIHILVFAFAVTLQRNSVKKGLVALLIFFMFHF